MYLFPCRMISVTLLSALPTSFDPYWSRDLQIEKHNTIVLIPLFCFNYHYKRQSWEILSGIEMTTYEFMH